jgi:choline-sulfatase
MPGFMPMKNRQCRLVRTICLAAMRNSLILLIFLGLLTACGGPDEPTSNPSSGESGQAGEKAWDNPNTEPWDQPVADGDIRNVLLITLDTTRADHLASYGSPTSSTPRMDALARQGVRFEQCISTAPITMPSHSSIMTGLYPYRHGVRNNGTHRLPNDVLTLAEALKDHGYATGATISAMVLNSRYGLDQGFDQYDQNLVAGSFRYSYLARETPAADTIRRAQTWLDGQQGSKDSPFFMWVHLFDPHHPYTPPPGYAERCQNNPYDGEIAYVDEQLGLLIDNLRERKMLRNTLVIVTGDHGESLGEHGESTHSVFLYDSATRVPLIISHPSLSKGSVVPRAVSHVDLLPTVLNLLQLPVPDGLDGVSLAPALHSAPGSDPSDSLPERMLYSESMLPYYNFGWADMRALRTSNGRYIRAPREELYAVVQDPGETINVLEELPDQVITFAEQLDKMLANGERDAQFSRFEDLPPAQQAALEALGYVSVRPTTESADAGQEQPDPATTDQPRTDPKDGILWFEDQLQALEKARRGDPDAEAALRAMLTNHPDDHRSRAALADLLVSEGRHQEALPLRLELIKINGAGTMELLGLATVEHELNLPAWQEHLAAAIALDPADPAPLIAQGDWQMAEANWQASIEYFEGALELDPGNLQALVRLGRAYQHANQTDLALAALEQALAINPAIFQLQFELGVSSEAQGKFKLALAYFERATQLDPSRLQAWRRLGSTQLRLGNAGAASDSLERAYTLGDKGLVTNRNLGLLRISQGDFALAIDPLLQASKKAPGDLQVQICLAIALDQQGKDSAAQKRLANARQIDAAKLVELAKIRKDVAAILQKYPVQ